MLKFGYIFIFMLIQVNAYKDVKVTFFGTSLDDYITYDGNNASSFSSIVSNYFDPAKKTVVYIHGWNEEQTSDGPKTILSAYLPLRSNWNLGYVNWQPYANCLVLLTLVPRINHISNAATTILKSYTNLNMSQTHIVGFSFGALIGSKIARNFNESGKPLARLTALEPANFYGTLDLIYKINKISKVARTDAKFVDVIHTNARALSEKGAFGHVDFWPNGGLSQPNCNSTARKIFDAILNGENFSFLGCSHFKAWRYYAESLNRTASSPAFIGQECPTNVNLDKISAVTCKTTSTKSMGLYADVTTTNRDNKVTVHYFVDVNASPPYSKN